LQIKAPSPPEDLVKQFFKEVGATGMLAERSRQFLSEAGEIEKGVNIEFEKAGRNVKNMWDEFSTHLAGEKNGKLHQQDDAAEPGSPQQMTEDEILDAIEPPPTPPWAHDPASGAMLSTQKGRVYASQAADEAAEASAMLHGVLRRLESKSGGLRQAWHSGASIGADFISSLEDVALPDVKTPYSHADGSDGTGLHCRQVCIDQQ
jgi:hypothetical protein